VYRVVLYCPDRHLVYEAATADRIGVGGGVTARLRLAQALAGQGCRVTVAANVPRRESRRGVEYVPLAQARRLEGDVLILNSTGGALDLSPVLELEVEARLRMVWVGGEARVGGLDAVPWDFVVAPSNYVRRIVGEVWGVPGDDRRRVIRVIPNGVPEPPWRPRLPWLRPAGRDPFRLVYTGHPAKGLGAALELLRLLRSEERRFELHVFGGPRLWGQEETPFAPPEGVVWHGLVGQRELGAALRRATFAIHLQGIADGFGIALAEAMAAGCIAVASRIGAYPELIRDGYDGFLIDGPHEAAETLARAARLILGLARAPELAAVVRRNAGASPLRWSTVARAWMGEWDRVLGGKSERWEALGDCPECGGGAYALADGYHCPGCGRFSRDLPG
jgi:glycosyltransferase involved in cell wall biosynthesis